MSWVIAGLIAAFLWALTNLLDQIVIRKYYPNQALYLTSINGVLQLIPFIILATLNPQILSVELSVIIILMLTAIVNMTGFLTYYKAIEKDEASNAIPIFQIQPVIIFMGAYFLFGETIDWLQAIGAALIILSSISIMFDFKVRNIKWPIFGLMLFCTVIIASTTLVDRYVLKDYTWDVLLAWKAIGYIVFSIMIFSVKPEILKSVYNRVKRPVKNGFQYILAVEISATVAVGFFLYSLAKTPAAGLTQTLTGFQTFFVLALGYGAYKLAPDFFGKPKEGFDLKWHLSCLVVMIIGLYLLNQS